MSHTTRKFFVDKPSVFNPTLEVAVVWLEVEGYVLFLQKSTSRNGAYQWAPFGGKVNRYEPALSAAVRETYEEVGIVIDSKELTHITTLYVKDTRFDFLYQMYGIRYTTRPDVVLSDEHQDYRWVTLDEALKLDLLKGAKDTIEIYRSRQKDW